MLYNLVPLDKTVYTGDRETVYDHVGSLSPDSMALIDAYTDASTALVEKYVGKPLGKRSIRLVLAKGETEVNDTFFKSWLSSGSGFGGYSLGFINQWLELPCQAESIESVVLGSWSGPPLHLVEGSDYSTDIFTNKARIMFSFNMFYQNYIYQFKNTVIDFTGGLYEIDGTLPAPIDIAIKCLTKKMFEGRGTDPSELIDNGIKSLLCNYAAPSISGGY